MFLILAEYNNMILFYFDIVIFDFENKLHKGFAE